jgi:N utilization substance protein B
VTATISPTPSLPPRSSRSAAGNAAPPAGTRKSSQKSPRARAREFALQGLYQYLVGGNDAASIDAFTRDLQGFNKADALFYDTLLHGCIETHAELDALITPLLDRPLTQISPIERGCMWLGAYELAHCPDVPWRVALNESIELAKDFGGADGHKYVNAVLSGVAQKTRAVEIAADRG